MCDGVTQGQPGMELSLFSRDVIAMATAVALAHNMFDAALCLGICDKIVPGLLIGTLPFGHLPVIFVPGRADALRPAQQGEGAHPPARTPRARWAARPCSSRRPRATTARDRRSRHRQQQPDADGGHGPDLPGAAFVRRTRPARCPHRRRQRAARITPSDASICPRPIWTSARWSTPSWAARHGARPTPSRWPSPAPPASRDVGRLQRSLRRHPPAGAHLPQRGRRREPLPRGGRDGLPRARVADGRAPARGHDDGAGAGPGGLHRGPMARRRHAGLAAGAAHER